MKNNSSMKNNKKHGTKSLGSLLRYMEGMEIIVELKTGKRHCGILTFVDKDMNLTLQKPQAPAPHQQQQQQQQGDNGRQDYNSLYPNSTSTTTMNTTTYAALQDDTDMDHHNVLSLLDIRGATIRYIQFPDNANISSMIRIGTERERIAANKYHRGKRKS